MQTYNIEREAKIRLDNKKLKEITDFLGQPDYFEQTNIIYPMDEGFLRLRKEKNQTIVTYKGERRGDKLGSRREYEFNLDINQFPVLKDVFEKIGLEESLYFTKKRAVYDFGPCKLFIDHIPSQTYLEIEGEYEQDILKTMNFFGFSEKDIEKRSYFEIMKEYNKFLN